MNDTDVYIGPTARQPGKAMAVEKARPIEVHKLCLTCRRRYPVGAQVCICGGRLYVAGVYRSGRRIGGGAVGQGEETGYEAERL